MLERDLKITLIADNSFNASRDGVVFVKIYEPKDRLLSANPKTIELVITMRAKTKRAKFKIKTSVLGDLLFEICCEYVE
jgi:hypothetical protein